MLLRIDLGQMVLHSLATINTNTGFIQIYETNTQGGKEVQGKMNNADEYIRKTLAQKKKDFDGEGFE